MSLRARLLLLVVATVATMSLLMLAIELNALVSVWLSHASERASSTAQFVKSYVQDRAKERVRELQPPPATLNERISLWRAAIEQDQELPGLLNTTLSQTRAIVEIGVAGEHGRMLANSNPEKTGQALTPHLPLKSLQELSPLDRLLQVLSARIDYENRVDLGVPGVAEPVFSIQVLVSSALLRDSIVPELKNAALSSLPLIGLAILLSFAVAQLALRPLAGISQTIDRIAHGDAPEEGPEPLSSTRELAVVQEKLRLLGEQFRGARQGATQLRGGVERLLERLEEAIFLFDAGGRLMVCGEPAERMLNMDRAAMAGLTAEQIFPRELPVGEAIAEALVARCPLRDHAVGRLILNLDFLPDGASLLRIRDAEGRRIVETQLNLSTRLAAISRLTGGVAHEIKNPLNSIALRLELLRSRVLPEVPEAKDEIEIIAQEITRLDRVVRTFLDFTRPVQLQTAEVDLAALTAGLVELVRPEAEKAGIALSVSGLDTPATLRGDRDLLGQALMNILRNAIEAMAAGAGQLTVDLRKANGEAVLEISDTGPGIPREKRDKIFELYYTTKEKGTGIGLAMAYRAVQLHDGSIRVHGDAGQGATFELHFPLLASEPLPGGTA